MTSMTRRKNKALMSASLERFRAGMRQLHPGWSRAEVDAALYEDEEDEEDEEPTPESRPRKGLPGRIKLTPLATWLGALFCLLVLVCLTSCQPAYHWPRLVAQGQRVMWQLDADNDGSPAASSMLLVPTIYIERDAWDPMSHLQHDFSVFHEWCHLARVGRSELMADCCSIREMGSRGLLWGSDVPDLAGWVGDWSETPNHPAGALRAMTIMICSFE